MVVMGLEEREEEEESGGEEERENETFRYEEWWCGDGLGGFHVCNCMTIFMRCWF